MTQILLNDAKERIYFLCPYVLQPLVVIDLCSEKHPSGFIDFLPARGVTDTGSEWAVQLLLFIKNRDSLLYLLPLTSAFIVHPETQKKEFHLVEKIVASKVALALSVLLVASTSG